jgi:hypothetical protein
VAVDPVQGIALGRAMLPYPGGAEGLVGIEGIQFGPAGRSSSPITAISTTAIRAIPPRPCNGRARISWPNTCCRRWAPRTSTCSRCRCHAPAGADCALQFGSVLDASRHCPASGLFLNGQHAEGPAPEEQCNGGACVARPGPHIHRAGPDLRHGPGRRRDLLHQRGEAGTDTLNGADGLGHWGPVHPPELGGAIRNANRYARDGFVRRRRRSGAAADRQVIEGAIAHRHGLQACCPRTIPYKSTAP